MRVAFWQCSGHYNWLNESELGWQVNLQVDNIRLSEVFSEEQNIDDWLPTEVAQLLLTRSEHYLYKSDKAEVKKNVEWIMEHASEVNDSYLLTQIANHNRQIARLESQLSEDYNG